MIKEKLSLAFMRFIPIIILYSITVFLLRFDNVVFMQLNTIFSYLLMPILFTIILYTLYNYVYAIIGFLIGALISFYALGFLGVLIALIALVFLKEHVKIFMGKKYYYLKMIGIFILTLGLIYLLSSPIIFILNELENFLQSLSSTNIMIFVGFIAVFTSIDLGGPFNKIAYGITLTFYLDEAYSLVGPMLIAVSIPPFTMFLASLLMPNLFSSHLKVKRRRTLIYASLGITEGAIPYVIENPKVLLPSVVIGSVIASVMAAFFNLENTLILTSVLGLIGTSHIGYYILSHIIGIISGLLMIKLLTLKRDKVESIV
jgi:fructose-specific phosphotransferase system IIC component